MASTRRPRTPARTAKDRALGLLAVRWRSREELRRRLLQAGFASEEIDSALADLVAAGLVDDDRFAREVVRDQVSRRRAGSRAILAELRRRGVAGDVAEAAVAETPDDDEARALSFAVHRASRLGTAAPDAAYRRLLGQLLRRGYNPTVARDAARRALAGRLEEAASAPEEA